MPLRHAKSHRCRHWNKRRRRGEKRLDRCKNKVADGNGHRYCDKHRTFWNELWWWLFWRLTAELADAVHRRRASRPWTSGPRDTRISNSRKGDIPRYGRSRDRVSIDQLSVAVQEANSITTKEWQTKALRRIASALDVDVFKKSRSRSASRLCRALAKQANLLLTMKKEAQLVLEDTSARFFRRPLTRLIARQFARRISAFAFKKVVATAHALQAYGVLICVLDDRDLAKCYCLRPLAKSEISEEIREQVRRVVEHGLDSLGRPSDAHSDDVELPNRGH
jgi:hypothetical protein